MKQVFLSLAVVMTILFAACSTPTSNDTTLSVTDSITSVDTTNTTGVIFTPVDTMASPKDTVISTDSVK